jgi:Fe-S-cluster containining protein
VDTQPADDEAPEFATATFRLDWHGRRLETQAQVPTAPVRPRILLPLIQQMTGAIVSLAEDAVRREGKSVSCRAGCGACCRQVVPLGEFEAYYIRDLVEAMPEPRRQQVRDRFAAGVRRLADAGLLDDLRHASEIADRTAAGVAYFQLGIACPFLEDESCSNHPDRPLSCREYLVTSPAENCRTPSRETVRQVLLPARPMPAYAALSGKTPTGRTRWVPMILALEWADEHPEPETEEPGTELFERFMRALAASRPSPPAPESNP